MRLNMFVLENLYKQCCLKHQSAAFRNGLSQQGHQTPHGPCRTQRYQDPFPQDHPGGSAHRAVVVNLPWRQIGGWGKSMGWDQCASTQFMSMWRCVKRYGNRGGLFMSRFIKQPAGDTSEETVRSNMKVHRCHRLHTEKEERVMLSLVSAYLVRSLLQCMPRSACMCYCLLGQALLNADCIYLIIFTYGSRYMIKPLDGGITYY